jgi:phosphoribosylformylglycinamidine (FGAM) synthase-like amidotransferase family enzyme
MPAIPTSAPPRTRGGCCRKGRLKFLSPEAEGRVVFRYSDAKGEVTDEANANGSMRNIAGIINEEGNVLGLMPHPERSVEALLGSTAGLGLFESLAREVEEKRVPAAAPS